MSRVIYWFRTDLRLHDSPALQAALDLKPEAFFPLWCWDPNVSAKVLVEKGFREKRIYANFVSLLVSTFTNIELD